MTRMMNEPSLPGFELSDTFILRQLEVFNWGPFGGRHVAEIDPFGTAVIGPTASGKTTLVDAFMTLIAANPKYNLASTGGHESDRDLISYIRGVAGEGNNSGDNSHVARAGKTSTAIQIAFSNGKRIVRMGAVFWIDGTSFAQSDLKRLWLFSECDGLSMEEWLTVHHEGGARALKQLGRETVGFQVFPNKKQYLAQVRRFYEVGENAFALLNRAAGLKQLNSINDIFRELVLDDHSAFQRATEVASEFDDLAAIRGELETARKQQESLAPIERANKKYQSCIVQAVEQKKLLTMLPVWFAEAGHRLWETYAGSLNAEIEALTNKIETDEKKVSELQTEADLLKDIYLKAGGAGVEQLEELINEKKKYIGIVQRYADEYRILVQKLGFEDTLSAKVLKENQKQAIKQKVVLKELSKTQENKAFKLNSELETYKKRTAELKDDLTKIQARPGSNIPPRYQDFRSTLAQMLDLPEEQLPFVAEMVEVKPDESEWRGAIERAIGSNRLRILVPQSSLKTALNWVNYRENRLHIRLMGVKESGKQPVFFKDGFTRKLRFKKHPHREVLQYLLSLMDRHCVESPEDLGKTPLGMTVQGLMSGKGGQLFEKQDQHPLHEGWMTGFSNKDRLSSLHTQLKEVESQAAKSHRSFKDAKKELKHTEDTLFLLSRLESLQFDEIDLHGTASKLTDLENQLRILTDPDSTVGKALKEYKHVAAKLDVLQMEIKTLNGDRGGLKQKYRTALTQKDNALKIMGKGLTDDQRILGEKRLPALEENHLELLHQMERDERTRNEKIRDKLEKKLSDLKQNLVRLMANAKKADTGALVETGTQLEDIPDFLERLRILNEESLPKKLNRFLTYLNQSSDQGVTQLLINIENEVSIIEERIADLNNTLERVDFQPGRFLQLNPIRVSHRILRELMNAQRRLRSAALKDDKGESQYRALENMVGLLRDAAEKKHTVAARALLDPRYRLQFAVSVLERRTGRFIEKNRTGSQGGSGGEKEIIASYILTASLSYALCPDGGTHPLFSTIILDEAFSKSSQATAGRIISALQEFGLHPLFVTPNKEMRLLRAHTRSAILVHRKGMQATLTSLSWEELESHAQTKIKNKIARRYDEVAG